MAPNCSSKAGRCPVATRNSPVTAHGTKGSAIISSSGHSPAHCRLFKGQNFSSKDLLWRFPSEEPDPYQLEWDHLVEAIRKDRPYNEAKRGAEASLVTAMGRMSAHTGQLITFDQMLNNVHELRLEVDRLAFDAPAPVRLGKDNKYPVPQPGIVTRREY